MRPKVYIVQETMKKMDSGEMAPQFDFRKVVEYGDPVVCLPSGRVSLSPGPTVDTLKDVLRDFTDNDYIVAVGDPSAMFITAMVAGELNRGRCKLLKWDKNAKQYVSIQIDLNHRRIGREDY